MQIAWTHLSHRILVLILRGTARLLLLAQNLFDLRIERVN